VEAKHHQLITHNSSGRRPPICGCQKFIKMQISNIDKKTEEKVLEMSILWSGK